jgi:squalene-hopene/tetraprenyl-beta-curcumene cyclase
MRCLFSFGILGLLCGFAWPVVAAEKPAEFPKPAANSAEEPLAKSFSLAAGARFLDAASVNWTQSRKCATCHTNVAYLMSRSLVKDSAGEGIALVRSFFEDRVSHWDDEPRAAKPRSAAEVIVTAVSLAFNDAQTTGKLHPMTRKALDRMWTLQRTDGAWNWDKCSWPPMEHDDYFGTVFADLGTTIAPDGYDQEENATKGLVKLRHYLKKTPPPTLHHRTWLLWASTQHSPGLMPREDRERTIKELLALQHADGGWSLASLGDWKGFDGRPNDKNAPSDGYGTGLVVYVLRQAGLPAKHDAIQRGVHWLQANQRASGRWFTRSLNTDRYHFISHAGTAFAVMALTACAEK